MLQYCADRLAKYKIPRLIEFRDSLPKAGTGKILRRALAEEEATKKQRRASRKTTTAEAAESVEELLETPEGAGESPS